jgi:hypothetical protein
MRSIATLLAVAATSLRCLVAAVLSRSLAVASKHVVHPSRSNKYSQVAIKSGLPRIAALNEQTHSILCHRIAECQTRRGGVMGFRNEIVVGATQSQAVYGSGVSDGKRATYVVSDATSSMGTAIVSALYLFHPPSVTKTYRITRLRVWSADGGAGEIFLQLNRITAENGTPGGTLLIPAVFNQGDPASSAIARWKATGSPTRDAVWIDASPGWTNSSATTFWEWAPSLVSMDSKCYELRPSVGEGIEVEYFPASVTSAPSFGVAIEWVEF